MSTMRQQERRFHTRDVFRQLDYVEYNDDNGAIVVHGKPF